MTPAARRAAAIQVLDGWLDGEGRVEPLLRAWGRASRYAGSKDRRAVADLVYDCVRRRRSLAFRSGASGGRGLIHGLTLEDGPSVEEIFSGDGHAPRRLTEDERAGRDGAPPDPVRYDHPDWLEAPLKSSLGAAYRPAMEAMRRRAPVDLRVNPLVSNVAAAEASLKAEGFEIERLTEPGALRCPPGAPVARSSAYESGAVELQDVASQAVSRVAGAAPGEVVLDYCAGGGGKALALAGAMAGPHGQEGRVVAHDVSPRRMADLPARAARARAKIELVETAALRTMTGAFDLIFVDAPCSGSGSWRRDAEGKWLLTPSRLDELMAAQRSAFDAATGFVKPGGRIAYATCSQLEVENQRQREYFQDRYKALSVIKEAVYTTDQGCDGLYVAVFVAD